MKNGSSVYCLPCGLAPSLRCLLFLRPCVNKASQLTEKERVKVRAVPITEIGHLIVHIQAVKSSREPVRDKNREVARGGANRKNRKS